MLFYIVLAAASVVAAVVFLWLFRALYDVSHRGGDFVVPGLRSIKQRRAQRQARQRMAHLNPAMSRSSSGAKVPWGWPGNSGKDDDTLIQWPNRHDTGFTRVSGAPAGGNGNGKKSGKPWGW